MSVNPRRSASPYLPSGLLRCETSGKAMTAALLVGTSVACRELSSWSRRYEYRPRDVVPQVSVLTGWLPRLLLSPISGYVAPRL